LTNKKSYAIIIIENEREVIKMRKLVYILENGIIETTEKAAKESGLKYRVALQNIPEPVCMTEKQKAMRIKL
jgi:hypothetical protein